MHADKTLMHMTQNKTDNLKNLNLKIFRQEFDIKDKTSRSAD